MCCQKEFRRGRIQERLEQKAAEQKDAQDDHDGNDYDFNQGHLGNLSYQLLGDSV